MSCFLRQKESSLWVKISLCLFTTHISSHQKIYAVLLMFELSKLKYDGDGDDDSENDDDGDHDDDDKSKKKKKV